MRVQDRLRTASQTPVDAGTGGSRGIGRVAAAELAKAGTLVAANYKSHAAEADAACAAIGAMGAFISWWQQWIETRRLQS
jgi:NAD(P)-dependent dehydrogenase (short-subunit alcohol dehydrogenase family)